jgi:hypothetical protein
MARQAIRKTPFFRVHSGTLCSTRPGGAPHNQQVFMTDRSPEISSASTETSQSLTDLIAERVINARLALEARSKKPSPSAELTETQSLNRVFRDLGYAYRRYRSQTGGPVVPGLRDAAYEFRANPSLPSLVAVAAYLEKLDLLS